MKNIPAMEQVNNVFLKTSLRKHFMIVILTSVIYIFNFQNACQLGTYGPV